MNAVLFLVCAWADVCKKVTKAFLKKEKKKKKRGLLALILEEKDGGGEHQSGALLVWENPAGTLNLSSASGSLYQNPVPYLSDPIIDSSLICLRVYSVVVVEYSLIGNRYRPSVSQLASDISIGRYFGELLWLRHRAGSI